MNYAKQYLTKIREIIGDIEKYEYEKIIMAAKMVADTLENDGFLYVFGTGHSHMLAEELFYRAGGLVRIYPILEESLMFHNGAVKSSEAERLDGYAHVILKNTPIKKGDTIIICSNSGRNAVPVEMAVACRDMGVKVIALTNMEHTTKVSARNKIGKRLYEVADIVLDNHGCLGDASIPCPPLGKNICPTSSIAGILILQMIAAQTVEELLARGIYPECYLSSNVDNGEKTNQDYYTKYFSFIKPL